MSTYKVVYERDEGGAWIAEVPSVPGCHTYGRTIEQARERVREALDLWVRDANTAYLVDDVRLPSRLRASVKRAHLERKKAEEQHERAQRTAAKAATELTRDLHVSLRDAGEVLGLSRQRVQQLTAKTTRRKSAAKHSVRRAAKSR
ncbi:MAG TPA: type II toxin-antitoxin system HicB family antitoxin [Candidatus Limnocylindria bacterium]